MFRFFYRSLMPTHWILIIVSKLGNPPPPYREALIWMTSPFSKDKRVDALMKAFPVLVSSLAREELGMVSGSPGICFAMYIAP